MSDSDLELKALDKWMDDKEVWDKVCIKLYGSTAIDDMNDMPMVKATKEVVLDEVSALLDEVDFFQDCEGGDCGRVWIDKDDFRKKLEVLKG